MNDASTPDPNKPYLTPVEGKFIFEVDTGIRVRFNQDGWVEEMVKPNEYNEVATRLQGRPGTKRDDIMARRFYDLYTRVVLIDIYPRQENDRNNASGMVMFKDLEKDSQMYKRISRVIEIAETFGVKVKPLD